jgi:transcriptional regulator with XRE-family HTH domain
LRRVVDQGTREVWAGRLRKARAARGYSQTDLAQRIGCTRAAVSAWERAIAAPPLETRRIIARALGKRIGALFPERAPRRANNNHRAK